MSAKRVIADDLSDSEFGDAFARLRDAMITVSDMLGHIAHGGSGGLDASQMEDVMLAGHVIDRDGAIMLEYLRN